MTTPETPVKEVEQATNQNPQIDYKAKYEAELAAREKAERVIVKHKIETKTKPEESIDEVEEVKQVPTDIVETTTSLLEKNTNSILNSEIKNEDERNLVKLHLDDIRRTGEDFDSIRRDISKARALANAKEYEDNKDELIRANNENKSMNNLYGGASSSSSSKSDNQPQFNNPEIIDNDRLQQIAKEKGLSPEATQKFINNLQQAKTGNTVQNKAEWWK